MKQEELIKNTDWDLLIILDDCRWDYFRDNYNDYLKGKLIKAISPASNTYEWCKKVIEKLDFSDTTVISANPHINSKAKVMEFDARKYFKKIVDVWLTDWDDKLPTVRPEVMAMRVKEVLGSCNNRVMAWFIQPHFPALSLGIPGVNPSPGPENGPGRIGKNRPFIKKLLGGAMQRYLPLFLMRGWWQFRLWRGKTVGPEMTAFAKVGVKRMREGYKENLKSVLEHVSTIAQEFRGKNIVVTSDHGELLGDEFFGQRRLGHPAGYRYRKLIEVPWLEVNEVI